MRAELIDHMGSDLTVVNAARVSFEKASHWVQRPYDPDAPEGDMRLLDEELPASLGAWDDYSVSHDEHGRELSDFMLSGKDEKLISYLAKHNHWTPFAHCMITLRETVPIFVARQRFKHTVGFSYNEVSRRYVDSEPEFYTPEFRKRAENKKQGSSDEVVDDVRVKAAYRTAVQQCVTSYYTLLEFGVAPEIARGVLPQSMLTSYYVTGSLAAFARAYSLRIDPHSQVEIQLLAKEWDRLISLLFPVSWKALTNG